MIWRANLSALNVRELAARALIDGEELSIVVNASETQAQIYVQAPSPSEGRYQVYADRPEKLS